MLKRFTCAVLYAWLALQVHAQERIDVKRENTDILKKTGELGIDPVEAGRLAEAMAEAAEAMGATLPHPPFIERLRQLNGPELSSETVKTLSIGLSQPQPVSIEEPISVNQPKSFPGADSFGGRELMDPLVQPGMMPIEEPDQPGTTPIGEPHQPATNLQLQNPHPVFDEQLWEQIKELDWQKIEKDLLVKATFCLGHGLADAFSPEDLVHTAVAIFLGQKTFNWDTKDDLAHAVTKYLWAIVQNKSIDRLRRQRKIDPSMTVSTTGISRYHPAVINEDNILMLPSTLVADPRKQMEAIIIENDLRRYRDTDPTAKIVFDLWKEGYTTSEISQRTGLSESDVDNAKRRWKRTGEQYGAPPVNVNGNHAAPALPRRAPGKPQSWIRQHEFPLSFDPDAAPLPQAA